MNKHIVIVLGFVMLTVAAPFAEAHTGIAQGGFLSGLSHPLLGIDHLLAMLAIGIWAGSSTRGGKETDNRGRASWSLPLLFIVVMAISAIALQGVSLPLVESGIAMSLLLIGLFVTFAVKLPLYAGMLMISLFAVFHGAAHGAEWPLAVSPVAYVSGFVVATAFLQAVGVLAAQAWSGKTEPLIRSAGVLISIAGGWLLLAS